MTAGALRASVFLLLLTLFLFGVNLVFTAREVAATRSAAASVVQLCQLGNESRAQQVTLWEYVVRVSSATPPPGESAAQHRARQRAAAAFLAHVRQIFRSRNCAALSR